MALEEFIKLVESKMEVKKTTTVYKGVTPVSLLGVAFIIMKILGYINWSWVWVLAPFWIPIGIALVLLLICFGTLFILAMLEKRTVKVKVEKKEDKVEEKTDETPKKKTATKKIKKNGGKSKEQNEKSSK